MPPSEVTRIAAIPDGAARNHLITNAYGRLAGALRSHLPGAANWCAFATWASRQAGETIRSEDLADRVRAEVRDSDVYRAANVLAEPILRGALDLAQLIIDQLAVAGPLRRSSEAVARGNKRVFEEIGLVFARLLASQEPLAALPDARIDACCGGLPVEPGVGPERLKQALRCYRSAAGAPPGPVRSQRILLGNVLAGLHEQTRLQPDIRAAMDGAVLEPGDFCELLLARFQLPRPDIPVVSPLRSLLRKLSEHTRDIFRRVVTKTLMTIEMPTGEVLSLHRDLSRPFPPDLRQLSDPDLRELLARFDPAVDDPAGSGAGDWADLNQRMRFIADLFRAYQDEPRLFLTPS